MVTMLIILVSMWIIIPEGPIAFKFQV